MYKQKYHVYQQTEIVNNFFSFKELAVFDKKSEADKFIKNFNDSEMSEFKAFYVKS